MRIESGNKILLTVVAAFALVLAAWASANWLDDKRVEAWSDGYVTAAKVFYISKRCNLGVRG